MNDAHIVKIADELGVAPDQVRATAKLFAEDATVPFIARYRKELTGGLDEVAVTTIRDRTAQLAELDKRREAILRSIGDQGKLTDALKAQIEDAQRLSALEDLYLPYRPKRRTRATVAREKGLEPLAQRIFEQGEMDPPAEAAAYVNADKGVASAEDALAGACDIIAEQVNEDQAARAALRALYSSDAVMHSKVLPGKESGGVKFRDYFDWSEPASKAPSHRVLAMRRGERERVLNLTVAPDEDTAMAVLEKLFVKGDNAASQLVGRAVRDSYRRLLAPSMATETRAQAKQRADEEAIRVFALNLRQLLLASPLGEKRILAIDPGLRTGCKVACLDRQGKLVHHDTVFPHPPRNQAAEAGAAVLDLCRRFEIEAIAIGNGTAGRETEAFVRGLDLPEGTLVVVVDESGASVYSASRAARQEFPKHDVTVRGAVSIGRRLMDPLAELVKIDPKSIGVGQYQHDVNQAALRRSLDDVVMSCVNAVGVEVNTCSRELLAYVSGLGPSLAKGAIAYRDQHGPFRSREELRKVPGLGPKAFEQAAGFLRIRDGENPLDASAVHPESYGIVLAMAEDLGCSVRDLMADEKLRQRVDLGKYVTDAVGMPTLADVMAELVGPGRDPREKFEPVRFQEGLESIEDLKPGMRLPGVVTNVTNFGVFVDVGVHDDGLVHISELANRFVKSPADVVKVHDRVTVRVLSVDLDRKRISLSMKDPAEKPATRRPPVPGPKAVARPERKPRPPRPKPVAEAKPKRGTNNPFADFFKNHTLPQRPR